MDGAQAFLTNLGIAAVVVPTVLFIITYGPDTKGLVELVKSKLGGGGAAAGAAAGGGYGG
eukprot:CAMPEP_0183597264 /NCGR_PEP_ID=MMETSP0371-20130417/176607_1 /TAXON_ID=268820 /ORGANISM="Peridinium aciculiferum, Strain PAER-2" /LENGTH=59 /DNA_ID=CAMNT_0025809217 /DNA_START=70 /DNA_END=245 /DNA_ORIENTATION=+